MPKIIKNGKEYSGVPIEVVTAWAPTADPVQVKEPLMGNTDISDIGDGTVTGAIDELNTGLTIHTISQEVNIGADITITGLPTGYVVISFIGYNAQYSLTYEGMQLVKDGFQIIYQTNGIRIINGSNTKYTVTFRYVIPI